MKRSLRTWLIVLSAVLVLYATTAEAIHIHSERNVSKQHSKKSGDSCLICHAAHSPILAAEAMSCPTPASVEESVCSSVSHDYSRLSILGHYVRPPPTMI